MSETSSILRRLTEAHKLTQTEIARLTGIPQPRLSRWKGEAPDSVDDGLKLAALLKQKDAEAAAAVTQPGALAEGA